MLVTKHGLSSCMNPEEIIPENVLHLALCKKTWIIFIVNQYISTLNIFQIKKLAGCVFPDIISLLPFTY